ncbi:MAG: exo-alpha-sialidase [Acidobacteria bacterium]|nr:exo-alpha-sialidase [Acidobacteriota bacterium]
MRSLAFFLLLLSTSCQRYADFTLPPAPGGGGPTGASPPPRIQVRPAPVMDRTAPGTWESTDVLNPSVVALPGGQKLLNVYSAYDGKTWHTGVAESTDGGLTWTNRRRVLSPDLPWEGRYIAANGTALVRGGGELLYWYQAGSPPRLGLARSSDNGATWRKHGDPVVPTGPRGSWDERGVADPYVIEAPGESGGALYMYFLGQNRARQQRLGLARSTDGGLTWTKLRSNPILEIGPEGAFDENGLGEPAIWAARGRWWMLYTGRDRTERRRLGLASSPDGVHWERWRDSVAILSGEAPWNSAVLCDPTVLPDSARPGILRLWFGGGDVPHPAENIHGAIGYAELAWN